MDMLQFDIAYVNYLIYFWNQMFICAVYQDYLECVCMRTRVFRLVVLYQQSAVFLRVCGLHFYKCLCTNWKYI